MKDNKKNVSVPYIEGLDGMDITSLRQTLKSSASLIGVDCVNWPDSFPYAPDCKALVARSRESLALSFDVCGMDLRATQMGDNQRSWEDSCCEFFIQSGEDGYFNIEITCIGSILMAFGKARDGRVRLSDSDVARIRRWSSLEKKQYLEEGGSFSWNVTVLIPFTLIGLDPDNLPAQVSGNFYKCADLSAHPHFLSWSPIDTENPDFHRPEFFGKLFFNILAI